MAAGPDDPACHTGAIRLAHAIHGDELLPSHISCGVRHYGHRAVNRPHLVSVEITGGGLALTCVLDLFRSGSNCILRGTDFLAELLPLICFFGVFWTEIAHTASRERLIVWLSGRTPSQCLLPALLFGLIVGVVQLALNYYLRPLAVMTMSKDRLGTYGERFDPRPLLYPQWFVAGDDIVQAMVEPGEPASLRDVKIYRMSTSLSLQTFFRANVAKPISPGKWQLIDGYRWSSPQDASQSSLAAFDIRPPAKEDQSPFTEETIDLELSPIWLNTYRVSARYLTHDVFSALGKEHFSPDSEYRTWEQVRWSLPMFCVALSLFATSLSITLMASGMGFSQLAIIAGAGYFANTLMKLLVLLGEHGYVHVAVAGWLVPLTTLAAGPLVTLLRRNPSDQLAAASSETIG